nr:hypothetical protein [Mycolicibacterium neoaurum]
MDRMPQPRDSPRSSPLFGNDFCRKAIQLGTIRSVVGAGGAQHSSDIFEHTEKHRAGAEDTCRDRTLQCFRSAGIGQPRRQRRRCQAMVGQSHQYGVEQAGFALVGKPAGDEKEEHAAKIHIPHQLVRELVPLHPDLITGRVADRGLHPWLFCVAHGGHRVSCTSSRTAGTGSASSNHGSASKSRADTENSIDMPLGSVA